MSDYFPKGDLEWKPKTSEFYISKEKSKPESVDVSEKRISLTVLDTARSNMDKCDVFENDVFSYFPEETTDSSVITAREFRWDRHYFFDRAA
jgi:hypothetical protein